jgi:hypothetical protein
VEKEVIKGRVKVAKRVISNQIDQPQVPSGGDIDGFIEPEGLVETDETKG